MAWMRPRTIRAITALVLGAGVGAVLAGCGTQTKTVSVSGPPPLTPSTTSQTTPSTSSTSTATATAPAPASSAGGTSTPNATRTAPEPAFAPQETHTEGLAQAVAAMSAHGYTPNETSQYRPSQTLQVLIGTKSGSSDGYDQQAFFFVNGHYIGTDAKEPSATVKVLAQSDTEVTLAYALYRKGDPLANPSGGQAIVHFALNDGKLTALGTIPPADSSTGPSRY